jgi:hypothetical protein
MFTEFGKLGFCIIVCVLRLVKLFDFTVICNKPPVEKKFGVIVLDFLCHL